MTLKFIADNLTTVTHKIS